MVQLSLHITKEELDMLHNLVAEDTNYHINEKNSLSTPEWYRDLHNSLIGKLRGLEIEYQVSNST